ncbi:MAG TPA: hypothetical protein DEB31_02910 [Clostridiales bacterium]|nr:hypothetical protein [Clostridiales bacterium]
MSQPVLQLKNVSKIYHDTRVLNNVNLRLMPGQVYALIGSNGAGKTTLTKIIAGETKPSAGEIYLHGERVEIPSPFAAKKLGIASCQQNSVVFDELSVTENLFLGSGFKKKNGVRDWPAMHKKTLQLLARFGIQAKPAQKSKNLSLAEKYLMQFARVLLGRYQIVILDELTDSLTMAEVDKVYEAVEQLKSEGAAVIYITHRIDEAIRIADMIGVMKDGEMAALIPAEQAATDLIANKMLGKDIKDHYPKLSVASGEVVMRVQHISNKFVKDISFSLRRGEVLGIAGLVGSGRTNLVKAIVGVDRLDEGCVEVLGGGRKNIGYMPENRDAQGLFEDFSVAQNVTIKNLERISAMHWIKPKKEEEAGADMMYRLGIRAQNIHQKVRYLSGGNKQKTLVGRCVFSQCSIYVFDEPTKGVDIAGKVEIYNIINELVRKGAAIILVSSDFSELAGMCDRVLVIRKGRMVVELSRRELDQQILFTYCKE